MSNMSFLCFYISMLFSFKGLITNIRFLIYIKYKYEISRHTQKCFCGMVSCWTWVLVLGTVSSIKAFDSVVGGIKVCTVSCNRCKQSIVNIMWHTALRSLIFVYLEVMCFDYIISQIYSIYLRLNTVADAEKYYFQCFQTKSSICIHCTLDSAKMINSDKTVSKLLLPVLMRM